jgi:hypothetical protein
VLLRNRIDFDVERLALAERRWAEMAPLLPFFDGLRQLQEDRFDRKRADGRATASLLSAAADQVSVLTKALAADAKGGAVTRPGITPVIASRAATQIEALETVLADWHRFYDGYDPVLSWWVTEPFGGSTRRSPPTPKGCGSTSPASSRASRRRSSATPRRPRGSAPTWRSR